MRDALLFFHVIGAFATLLTAVGQLEIGRRLRSASTPATLIRRGRILMGLAIALTLVIVLVLGAGFALLEGLWAPSDPWVASALLQAFVLLLITVTVVIPATQRIGDLAENNADQAIAVARDPLLATALAVQPMLLVTIAVLMFNKPPLAGAVEIPAVVLVAGLAVWTAYRWPPRLRALTWAVTLVVLVAGSAGFAAWRNSVSYLPAAVALAPADAHTGHLGAHQAETSVTSLTEPASTAPVREVTVTAEPQRRTIGGRSREVWRLNTGQGGSEIRVPQGTLIIAHLVNRLPVRTSIHWHGVNVPNSQDGVAGVTQDAVIPGGTFTYRFIADRAGTYWYHAHQDSVHQVQAGLFGTLVVTPKTGLRTDIDQTVELHTWKNGPTTLDGGPLSVAPGKRVRLRVVNTDSVGRSVALTGTPFQVAAIDGYEIPGAAMLTATRLTIPGGGRYDLLFQQPTVGTPWLQVLNGAGTAALAVGNTAGHAPAPGRLADFDLTRYGTHSRAAGLTPETRYTRDYTIDLDAAFGWYNGHFGLHYTMNGKLFPDGPMLHVREGDTVKVTFVNRTSADHPMHLHGHHFTVLEKDGKPLTGAPMELDTLNVEPHETWTIAFRADNPGLWMFHCHNLTHASQGMDMMVMYEGVTSPYTIGDRSANHPE